MGKGLKNKVKVVQKACAVTNCSSNKRDPVLTFHSFPRKKNILQDWKAFSGLTSYDGEVPKKYKVCSAHFTMDSFSSIEPPSSINLPPNRILKKNAVPTIHFSSTEEIKIEDHVSEPKFPYPTTILSYTRCRICLHNGKDMEHIFNYNKPNYAEKIIECGQINIGKDDGFPQNICDSCIRLLDTAYQFKLNCQKSNKILQSEAINIQNEFVKKENFTNDANQVLIEEHNSSPIKTQENDDYPYFESLETCLGNSNDEASESDWEKESNSVEADNPRDTDWLDGKAIITSKKEKKNKTKKEKQVPKAKQKRIRNYVKKHQCDECGYLALHPFQLKDHKSSHHEGIKSYQCDECQQCFATRAQMRSHSVHMHDHVSAICEQCGKTFRNIKMMKAHRKIHFAEKRYQCELCSFKTIHKGDLKIHMVVHTGERKHGCRYCDKFFGTSSARAGHTRRTHLDLRNFKCDYCDKSFGGPDMLRKHQVVHTGMRPYYCPLCPTMSYAWYTGLKTHQLSAHPDLVLESENVMYKKFKLGLDSRIKE